MKRVISAEFWWCVRSKGRGKCEWLVLCVFRGEAVRLLDVRHEVFSTLPPAETQPHSYGYVPLLDTQANLAFMHFLFELVIWWNLEWTVLWLLHCCVMQHHAVRCKVAWVTLPPISLSVVSNILQLQHVESYFEKLLIVLFSFFVGTCY